jgi:hypothetical protein
MLKIVIAFLVVLLLGASDPPIPSGGNAQSEGEAQAADKHENSQPNQRGTPEAPFIVQIQPPGQNRVAPQSQQERYWYTTSEGWTAAFTLGLFISTTGLWVFTAFLWNTVRRDFDATHRPKITVRGFQTLTAGSADEDVSVTFLYVNTGDTNAIVTEIGTKIVSGEIISGIIFDRAKIIPNVVLTSGEKEISHVEDAALYIARLMHQFSAGTAPDHAHLVGFVRYQDRHGRQRETGFCRTFHADGSRWIKPEDSEYEYQD